MPSAVAVEVTRNRKTGPISVTRASLNSCPPCPLKGNGCYAENPPFAWHVDKLTNDPVTDPVAIAREEAAAIDGLTARNDLRVHDAGDCKTAEAAAIVGAAMKRYEQRSKKGAKAWTYTHAWRDIPVDAWQGATVLASCESEEDVHDAQRRGYRTAVVVPVLSSPGAYSPGPGLTYIPCPEQTLGIQCVDCRLCSGNVPADATIAFAAHGSRKAAVIDTLREHTRVD